MGWEGGWREREGGIGEREKSRKRGEGGRERSGMGGRVEGERRREGGQGKRWREIRVESHWSLNSTV